MEQDLEFMAGPFRAGDTFTSRKLLIRYILIEDGWVVLPTSDDWKMNIYYPEIPQAIPINSTYKTREESYEKKKI